MLINRRYSIFSQTVWADFGGIRSVIPSLGMCSFKLFGGQKTFLIPSRRATLTRYGPPNSKVLFLSGVVGSGDFSTKNTEHMNILWTLNTKISLAILQIETIRHLRIKIKVEWHSIEILVPVLIRSYASASARAQELQRPIGPPIQKDHLIHSKGYYLLYYMKKGFQF